MDPVHIVVLVILLIVAAVLSHYYWVILEKISGKIVGRVLSRHYKKQEQTHSGVANQLKHLHSLARIDITSVEFTFDKGENISLQNHGRTGVFKEFLLLAKVSAWDDNVEQLTIEIHTHDDSFSYDAFVPTDNKDDVILRFSESGDYGGIRLPGLKCWLDENALNKKE